MTDDKNDHVSLVPFTKKAAEATFNPAEAVAELQRRIADGTLKPDKIVMFIVERAENGNWLPQNWRVNVTAIEALSIIELCKDDIIREIKGDG